MPRIGGEWMMGPSTSSSPIISGYQSSEWVLICIAPMVPDHKWVHINWQCSELARNALHTRVNWTGCEEHQDRCDELIVVIAPLSILDSFPRASGGDRKRVNSCRAVGEAVATNWPVHWVGGGWVEELRPGNMCFMCAHQIFIRTIDVFGDWRSEYFEPWSIMSMFSVTAVSSLRPSINYSYIWSGGGRQLYGDPFLIFIIIIIVVVVGPWPRYREQFNFCD